MRHLGDYDASTVIYGHFSTYRPSTGAAYTLAGSPVLSVYKDNSTTQTTTGVTLTADFDSVTGLNQFTIDTSSDGSFYSTGSNYSVVITTGTVDSVSVVGSVVASFTIRKGTIATVASSVSSISSAVTTATSIITPHLGTDYSFELVIGDDYYSAESRNLSFTIGASPSLSGATVTFEIQTDVSEAFEGTNISSTSATATGTTTQTITVDIPRTLTTDLSEGWHAYRIKAVLSNSHVVTLIRGRVNLLQRGDDAP